MKVAGDEGVLRRVGLKADVPMQRREVVGLISVSVKEVGLYGGERGDEEDTGGCGSRAVGGRGKGPKVQNLKRS